MKQSGRAAASLDHQTIAQVALVCAQVCPSTVATVRDALLQAGEQIWRPLGLDPLAMGSNDEVNEALQQLLNPRSFRVGTERVGG